MTAVSRETLESYETMGRALRLTSGALEAIVTLDVGPRTMHLSLPGGPNMFDDDCSLREDLPDGTVYEYLGGHRVWHSPEAFPRSYVPDGHPLDRCDVFDDGVLMVQAEEPWTHIVKSVELRFRDESVAVRSSLTNRGAWPTRMAVWSLFLGAPGGRLILPVPRRDTGLLPNRHYVTWPYARTNDPRVYWGERYIVLDHDAANDSPFKMGYPNEAGWMAYVNRGCCLMKTFSHERVATYPDRGCSTEAYTAGWGIDIESLSPLQEVAPGGTISHDEEWFLFECPTRPATDEDEIGSVLEPMAQRAGCELPAATSGVWNPRSEGAEDGRGGGG
jgi:hypothetical protein